MLKGIYANAVMRGIWYIVSGKPTYRTTEMKKKNYIIYVIIIIKNTHFRRRQFI